MNALKLRAFFPSAVLLVLTLTAPAVRGQSGVDWLRHGVRSVQFVAKLSGFQEVPPRLSNGTGRFRAVINDDNTISFSLSYSGLSGPATASHVHFGQAGVSGGGDLLPVRRWRDDARHLP